MSEASAAQPLQAQKRPSLKPGERACPVCSGIFPAGTLFCPDDGSPLEAAAAQEPDPYLGQEILGHVEIRKLAGVGAMGRVYRAHQKGLDRDVAVKILHRELSTNKELTTRFHREAKLASKIVHSNVVQVHLAGQLADGAMYIVMEYLDGLSLQSAMAASPTGALPLRRALRIALQLCEAMGEAHAHGIVHRDLKPENVMLVQRGDDSDFVKVLDFGIARANQSEGSMATAAGLIFGTARYISPEGARGEPATPASDVYSMATLIYQLLAGRTPFDAEQAVGLLLQHIHEPPPPFETLALAEPVPPAVAGVILKNLGKDPTTRSADGRRFAAELEHAIEQSGLTLDPRRGASVDPKSSARTTEWTPGPSLRAMLVPSESSATPGPSPRAAPATELSTPEPRHAPKTELATPSLQQRGLLDQGTLRLTPSRPFVPPTVAQPLAPASPPPSSSAASSTPWGRWALGGLLCLGLGLGLGVLVLEREPVTAAVPMPPLPVGPTEHAHDDAHAPAVRPRPPTEVAHTDPQELERLLPLDARPAATVASEKAATKSRAKVTLSRTNREAVVERPVELVASVLDGKERVGNKVTAASFVFRGDGVDSRIPAALDAQGNLRASLTFFAPGRYSAEFTGVLDGKPLKSSQSFLVQPASHPHLPVPAESSATSPAGNGNAPPSDPGTIKWL